MKSAVQLILAALVLILLTWYCSKNTEVPGVSGINYRDSVVVVYDTVTYLDTTKPELTAVDPLPIPEAIDTAAIIQAFFTRKTYQDSLEISDVRIKVDYSLLGNAMGDTRWQVVNLRPTTFNHYPANLKRHDLAAGMLMGVNLMAPTLGYQYKKLHLQIGYNFIQQDNNPAWVVGVHYSLLRW
tara:strand:+ start:16762 stop:17310 length:549 start_codon:yes stop_codon:yes gene_type:complete